MLQRTAHNLPNVTTAQIVLAMGLDWQRIHTREWLFACYFVKQLTCTLCHAGAFALPAREWSS